jgi:endoglucanase
MSFQINLITIKIIISYIMSKTLSAIIIFLSVFFSINSYAQGFLRANNKQIVNGNNEEIILRGIGLGGWMLQEGYMMQTSDFASTQHELKNKISALIGQQGMEDFYEAWLGNHVREIDIDSLAAWGFNSVRLPMHYNLYTLPIEEEPVPGQNTWLQKGFILTDSLLKWCKKNKLYLILDLHAAPGGQGKDAAISDYDPSKPSLWESEANRKKTVALWKKLAERYANEEWIGGYDLINETNWDMQGNAPLKNLYKEITDSIRKVDQNHIIFIEGNWFANDFTGLTPPWDNNMVYSFHKYWTYNNQASIQWVINLRETYNIPLWMGESGENSNTWFQEAVGLFETNNIGWAWWPMKKIGSIAGPLSIKKTDAYQKLIDYWKGQAPKPTVEFATNALMELAEMAKSEHCEFHPDVIDALFRQQKTSEPIPYKQHHIPGNIFAPDFDLGPNGSAYFDKDIANYHLSTNNYVAWNRGWQYRNDGVDIETCEDTDFSNGYNIGHTEDGEWMVYTIKTDKTAAYKINIRTAGENSKGVIRLQEDGVDICAPVKVQANLGWQKWQNTVINNVILTKGEHRLKLIADTGGFNFNSIQVSESSEIENIPTEMLTALTASEPYTILVNINKALQADGITASLDDFKVSINGTEVPCTGIRQNETNLRQIELKTAYLLKARNKLLVTYTGDKIKSTDGKSLEKFTKRNVMNLLPIRHELPVRIQAEDFHYNNGLSPETCTDTGGGIDMGWTDTGDYLDYLISVETAGSYLVNYRIASLNTAGQIELQLVGETTTSLHTIDLSITGGWQTWTTVSKEAVFPKGQHILRLLVKKGGFNINWLKFDLTSSMDVKKMGSPEINIFPNPAKDKVFIRSGPTRGIAYQLYNLHGQKQLTGKFGAFSENYELDVSGLAGGIYFLQVVSNENTSVHKIIITD